MKINNDSLKTNKPSSQVEKSKGLSFSSPKKQLAIALAALGIGGVFAAEKIYTSTASQDTHTQYITNTPTQDLSSTNTTAFFPEKGNLEYNKDSLNHIIEARIAEIQKQRESEFLQAKFIVFQKDIIASLNEFMNDQIFPKEKQENLSDEHLQSLKKNLSSAKDLASLSSACQKIISYIDKLLNKKDVEINGKTLKTKNIKDSEFFVKLDEYKNTFKEFITAIENTHFEPEVFKNVQPNADVL